MLYNKQNLKIAQEKYENMNGYIWIKKLTKKISKSNSFNFTSHDKGVINKPKNKIKIFTIQYL